ncbi:hypothetical protein C1H46_023148 [Malus baccata]|uniref:Uncharacterized protein n=1 Tax=Malus baccata TaxID=106549 RepID=A0A540LXN9_MALBA|nr:hypothetical protein C1H46_023148 [Malus baccata]
MGNEMGNNNTSGLRDEENTTVGEVADKPLAETTLANDTKEENEVVPEDEGKDFHENITNLASDDPKRIQDTCVDDQTSDITEEEGTMSTSHDPGPKESTHVELHHHEMATVDADDRTVEDVSGSLEGGSEDSLGSNPDFEVNGHLSDAEALEIVGESVDPVMEKQRDDLLLEPKASQEQFESFEEKSETTDGGKVECGFSIVTATASMIQKSPSFSLDLQNEARTEESDSTPLLYHVKAAIEGSTSQGDDVTLGSFIEYTGYDQEVSQYQAMLVEGKVIALEASNSQKSNTPFIGFLKEEEEARTVVTPQEDDKHSTAENSTKNLLDSHTKEAARAPTTSSKGKAKRRQRSSLFTNCMCCATVIN